MPEEGGAAPRRYRVQAEGEELHLAAGQLRLLPPPKPGPAKPEGGGIKRIRDRSGGGNAAPAKPAEPATAEPAPADDAPADPAPADEAPADEAPADDAPPEPKRACLPSPVEAGGAGGAGGGCPWTPAQSETDALAALAPRCLSPLPECV